jgi:hypothetical protein
MNSKLAYSAFLESPFWLVLRDKCIERDKGRCTQCGSKHRLQAHHHTYPVEWNDTTLDHLTTLCRACHRKAHGLPPEPRRAPPKPKPQPKPKKRTFTCQPKKNPKLKHYQPIKRIPAAKYARNDMELEDILFPPKYGKRPLSIRI